MKLFDLDTWRMLVKHERIRAGLHSVRLLSQEIKNETGLDVNHHTLYRIEQGRQEPTCDQFFAINATLLRDIWPDENKVFRTCINKREDR